MADALGRECAYQVTEIPLVLTGKQCDPVLPVKRIEQTIAS